MLKTGYFSISSLCSSSPNNASKERPFLHKEKRQGCDRLQDWQVGERTDATFPTRSQLSDLKYMPKTTNGPKKRKQINLAPPKFLREIFFFKK